MKNKKRHNYGYLINVILSVLNKSFLSFKLNLSFTIMCHCHYYIESGLSAKDFLNLIGTAIVVLFSYWGISKQVRKNRRVKWVEDFRIQAAKYLTILRIRLHSNNAEDFKQTSHSLYELAVILTFYLNRSIDSQSKLLEYLEKISTLNFTILTNEEIKKIFNDFGNLVKEIIEEEQAKI